MIVVELPGLLTTVQDGGRFGYEQYGLPQSGAMDTQAMETANVLVDNDPGEGVLEITMTGPALRFEEDCVFAVAGAVFALTLDGKPIETGRAYAAKAGETLTFGALLRGCRAYFAVSGGFALPKVLGSLSTSAKHHLGGFEGRRLEKGDRLPLKAAVAKLPNMDARVLPDGFFGDPARPVRVILGPQDDRFTEAGLRTFLTVPYTVSQNSDRMGYRLSGPVIQHVTDGNILSDGIAPGSVQVPMDGQPIVMMADRQTVGGYTKIATVITVDLPRIAQSKAGDTLRFAAVPLLQAQALYKTWCRRLDWLKQKIERPENSGKFPLLLGEYTVETKWED